MNGNSSRPFFKKPLPSTISSGSLSFSLFLCRIISLSGFDLTKIMFNISHSHFVCLIIISDVNLRSDNTGFIIEHNNSIENYSDTLSNLTHAS